MDRNMNPPAFESLRAVTERILQHGSDLPAFQAHDRSGAADERDAWSVTYRDHRDGRLRKASTLASRDLALSLACERGWQGHDVLHIDGPCGENIGSDVIQRYCGQQVRR